MLVSSWVGSNDHDTEIVKRISRKEYRDIETLLQSAELPQGPWVHQGEEWSCASRDFVWDRLANKVTETMLKDFLSVVDDVLGEEDPALALPAEQRYMAELLGKSRKHSSTLRQGLVDSVARLAVKRSDGQEWADRIVYNLLDPQHPKAVVRWLSLQDVYSELAEASPPGFLDSLDRMCALGNAGSFFPRKGEDGSFLSPATPHVDLLWALERLAWQDEHFVRAISALGRLAAADPDPTHNGNSPHQSLVTILTPWCPQHTQPLLSSVGALKMLHASEPEVAWQLVLELLPDEHSWVTPTSSPEYRPFQGERRITVKEYWEFVEAVVALLLEWVVPDGQQLVQVVNLYPNLRRLNPPLAQTILDRLSDIASRELGNEVRWRAHDAIRELVAHHREYCHTEWALEEADLQILEGLAGDYKPSDPVLLNVHLFSGDPHIWDATVERYGDDWEKLLEARRLEAVQCMMEEAGIEGVFRLTDMAGSPDTVGTVIGTLQLSLERDVALLRDALATDPSVTEKRNRMVMARAAVWARHHRMGIAWVADFVQMLGDTATPTILANIGLGLPTEPETWDLLDGWGAEARSLYWSHVWLRSSMTSDWERVLAELRGVGRYWNAIMMLGWILDRRRQAASSSVPDAGLVAECLGAVLDGASDAGEEHVRRRGLRGVEDLFCYLDSQDFEQPRLARLEYGWLHALERTKRGARILLEELSSNPGLFVELLKLVYRAEGQEPAKDIDESIRQRASQAHHMLKQMKRIPGQPPDGTEGSIDVRFLKEWVTEARRLASEAGRQGVCDSQIGQMLSYAPQGEDGTWPCLEVRDLLEELQNADIEGGMVTGKFNQRGVGYRGSGGDQEGTLAQKYRDSAAELQFQWPRTANMLNGMADTYERQARFWDEDASRMEFP